MKGLLAFLAGILVACAAAFVALPYIVPAEAVRDAVAQRVEAWTGQRLTFNGPAELGVFPNLRIEMRDVALAPANGAGGGPLLAVDMLSGRVRLWPLLFGEVQVDEFSFVRPRLSLHVDGNGVTNWQLPQPVRQASAAPTPTGPAASPAQPAEPGDTPLRDIRVGSFSITDGRFRLVDERSGKTTEATGINAQIGWPAMTQPLSGSGSLIWNGEAVSFEASASDALKLATGGSSDAVSLKLSAAPLQVALAGSASTVADLAFNGTVDAAIPSVRALARWAGVALPSGPGLDNLKLRSKFVAGGGRLAFSEARLALDGNAAEGALMLKIADNRPSIQATLGFTTLNLNPYLPARGEGPGAREGRLLQPTRKAGLLPSLLGVSPAAAQSSDGAAQGGGTQWSQAPIDIRALRDVDADVRISAQKINARNYDLGGVALTVSLQAGQMKANVAELTAYGGRVSANLSLDATGEAPAGALTLQSNGVALRPFLKDMLSFERLSGAGDVTLDIATHGPHQAGMIGNLRGKAVVRASKGQIHGFDIAQILRNVQKGDLTGWQQNGAASTVFDRLHASYDIASGVAGNQDLILESAAARVTGSGRVNLVERSIDYRLRGALLRQGENAEGKPADSTVEIPFIARGPWASPSIYPDAEELLKSPAVQKTLDEAVKALEKGNLKDVGKALKDGGLNSVLDRLRGR